MKIGLISDTHLGVKQNSRIMTRNIRRFMDETFFPTLKERGIDTIVHLGDLTDNRQSINFHTLKALRESFIHPIENRGIQCYTIVGNHDAYYRSSNSINSVQELLPETPQFYSVVWPTEIPDLNLLLIPWINQENEERCLEKISSSNMDYCLGHFELSGFEYLKGIKAEEGMDPKVLRHFHKVFSGHYHSQQSNLNVTYLGSPYQMSFADSGEARGFHIFDIDTGALEFVENPHKLFYKIDYNDSLADRGKDYFSKFCDSWIRVVVGDGATPKKLNKFIDKIYKQTPADVSVIENFNRYDAEEIEVEGAEDTLTLLNRHVDELDIDCDAAKLKSMMASMYTEAQSERVS